MLVELITTCERATASSMPVSPNSMRCATCCSTPPPDSTPSPRAVVALTVRIPEAEATLAALGGQFPASVLATVHDNPAMARERITFAEQNIEAGT